MKQIMRVGMIFCVFAMQLFIAQAQDAGLTLISEVDIGTDCPVSSAIQPETEVMWVLMDNCGGYRYYLQAYDRSGTALDQPTIPVDDIDGDLYDVFSFGETVAFTPDGMLQIMAVQKDEDEFTRFQVDMASGTVTSDEAEDINAVLRQYSEFPAFATTFNNDHTRAVVGDDAPMKIVDLSSGEALFEVDLPGSLFVFSEDGQRLYVNAPVEPENYENFDSTLFVYSLPDGAVIQTLNLPLSTPFPSADGRFIAIEIASPEAGNEQLAVVNGETGAISAALPISVPSTKAMTCYNTGQNISDLDFTASGRLSIRGLVWLPDNAGFLTFDAYDGTQTNTGCIFEYSRLRQYRVG